MGKTGMRKTDFRDLVEPLKKTGTEGFMERFLADFDAPHKDILNRIIESHHKAKAESRNGKTDLEHIQEVVGYMNKLLDKRFKDVLVLDSKSRKSDEYGNLEEIVGNLDREADGLLLCTALYHDIGKAIIRPRHGPEGADIIKDSDSEDRERFFNLGFYRSDIYLMSDLIRFHDYLAMVGTGETSYLTFTEVLHPVTNISLNNEENFLSYLLLLNLADIAGTIGKIRSEHFTRLMRDFKLIKKAHNDISRKVYEDIFKKKPEEEISESELHGKTVSARDLVDVISELKRLTENTTSERLRRILRAGFETSVGRLRVQNQIQVYEKSIDKEYVTKKNSGQYQVAKKFKEWFVNDDIAPVIASLHGLNIGQEFYTRFAFICKLDYELGFITELCEERLKIEIEKSKKGSSGRSSGHDLRRDLALCLVKLIDTLVRQFGVFTLNNTRIGLGFERITQMDQVYKERFLRRLTGADGGFKEAEALTKLRNSINLWVITP